MVLTFASAGADVVIASRKLDACEELAKEVRDTTGRVATLSTETGNRGMSLSAAPYGHLWSLQVKRQPVPEIAIGHGDQGRTRCHHVR